MKTATQFGRSHFYMYGVLRAHLMHNLNSTLILQIIFTTELAYMAGVRGSHRLVEYGLTHERIIRMHPIMVNKRPEVPIIRLHALANDGVIA